MQIMQQHLKKEDGDIEGTFTIALAAAKTENDTSSQVVVAGSMELFTDSTDQIVSGATYRCLLIS